MQMKEGDLAPDFSLESDDGKVVSLSNIDKNIVIYFYPKDNTPGCTIEASGFAALHGEFIKYDTIIFGVSKDSISSHQRFKEKYTLPFTLLSDPNGAMCTNYGTWKEKSMFGKKYMGIDRQTFLIGKDKKVKYIWHSVQVRTHAKDVLAKIIELN